MIEVTDLYAALVASSDAAIVAKDLDGIIVAWNPAAERLFGYGAEEMVGRSIRILLPDDRQDEEDRILARIRAGERVEAFYTKRRRKDGGLVDISVTISPVRDSGGTIVGASKIARDAGPELEAQQRIRESEARFLMLANNIDPLAWIARPTGERIWFNQRWYEYTGSTRDLMLGPNPPSLIHPDHHDRVWAGFSACLVSGEDWEDTFPLKGGDGEYRWFLSRAIPNRDEEGNALWWFGTNTDITEQREQAEQIRLLLMEVNHRAKNMLSTVQALARRTAGGDAPFLAAFEDRIRSLAVNQDILVRREWREVPLEELVRLQLSFLDGVLGEVATDGPPIALTPRAAEVIGMALHELGTNSLKYGALSAENGRVAIDWTLDSGSGQFTIGWHESGGPPVTAPKRTGFGTTLIQMVPRQSLAAEVALDYQPDGLRWSLSCPSAAIVAALAGGN